MEIDKKEFEAMKARLAEIDKATATLSASVERDKAQTNEIVCVVGSLFCALCFYLTCGTAFAVGAFLIFWAVWFLHGMAEWLIARRRFNKNQRS